MSGEYRCQILLSTDHSLKVASGFSGNWDHCLLRHPREFLRRLACQVAYW